MKPAKSQQLVNELLGNQFEQKQLESDLAELALRDCEAINLYEPLSYQRQFHESKVQQCLVQKGNRTGATLSLMVELARAVTGQDPFHKYPKEDGKAVIVVYGEKHVGRVVFNGLFRSGHFKGFRLIRDLNTGAWRAYRPWPVKDGGDLERFEESRPHGPLIPKRYIDGRISWLKRSERIFSMIRFTTGWELYAANSAGDPGQFQGMSINLYGIDEDLATSGWYEEALGRLTDVGGLLRWTALPHAKNDEMMKLIELAEKEVDKPKPDAIVIRASIFDNKFLDPEKRDSIVASWRSMGEDVYRKRVHGELDMASTLMYPTFNRRTHDVMYSPTLAEDQEELRRTDGVIHDKWDAPRILAARMGEPPDDWTRYASCDPGYNTFAIEFLAVPPPELGEYVFVYDECYLHEAFSWHFGEAMRERCEGKVIQAFYMDFHGGKLRSLGSGQVPIEEYREALKVRGVRSEATDHSFWPGCDDVKYREEVMREHLAVQRHGRPKLMIVAGKCPAFASEMEKFRKKTIRQRGKDLPTDEGDRRAGTHAIEAVEQSIAAGLPYVKPRPKAVHDFLKKPRLSFEQRCAAGQRAFAGRSYISLGPQGVRT